MGPEPNNFFTDEKCGGANFTEIREAAAGWADWRCSDKFIYMCRMLREWHGDVVCGTDVQDAARVAQGKGSSRRHAERPCCGVMEPPGLGGRPCLLASYSACTHNMPACTTASTC